VTPILMILAVVKTKLAPQKLTQVSAGRLCVLQATLALSLLILVTMTLLSATIFPAHRTLSANLRAKETKEETLVHQFVTPKLVFAWHANSTTTITKTPTVQMHQIVTLTICATNSMARVLFSPTPQV
jgi:hypothetical protein